MAATGDPRAAREVILLEAAVAATARVEVRAATAVAGKTRARAEVNSGRCFYHRLYDLKLSFIDMIQQPPLEKRKHELTNNKSNGNVFWLLSRLNLTRPRPTFNKAVAGDSMSFCDSTTSEGKMGWRLRFGLVL